MCVRLHLDLRHYLEILSVYDSKPYACSLTASSSSLSPQTREFWRLFVRTFDKFLWDYGILRDFPMTVSVTWQDQLMCDCHMIVTGGGNTHVYWWDSIVYKSSVCWWQSVHGQGSHNGLCGCDTEQALYRLIGQRELWYDGCGVRVCVCGGCGHWW